EGERIHMEANADADRPAAGDDLGRGRAAHPELDQEPDVERQDEGQKKCSDPPDGGAPTVEAEQNGAADPREQERRQRAHSSSAGSGSGSSSALASASMSIVS